MSLLDLGAVFVGGGLGAAARYGMAASLTRIMDNSFPFGTLGVNLLGSTLMGVVIGLLLARDAAPVWRLFLATGILGGFTTFSAFAFETVALAGREAWGAAALYVVASVAGCICACFAGLKITQAVL